MCEELLDDVFSSSETLNFLPANVDALPPPFFGTLTAPLHVNYILTASFLLDERRLSSPSEKRLRIPLPPTQILCV